MRAKPLLVGQDPAWWPTTEDRPAFVGSDSGERLAGLAGLEHSGQLLDHFALDNVFRVRGAWDRLLAVDRVQEIMAQAEEDGTPVVVFLGARARDAAGLSNKFPMRLYGVGKPRRAWMPHPSGLTRYWNDEDNRAAALRFLTSITRTLGRTA